MQNRIISTADALEIPQFCAKQSKAESSGVSMIHIVIELTRFSKIEMNFNLPFLYLKWKYKVQWPLLSGQLMSSSTSIGLTVKTTYTPRLHIDDKAQDCVISNASTAEILKYWAKLSICARLRYLQCWCTGDTAVLCSAIDVFSERPHQHTDRHRT